MMKSIFAAVALLGLAGSAALAQDAPATTPEECLKRAFDIAQSAESKKLPTDQIDQVEQMLTKMEGHCDAKQYAEAAAVASELKSLISKQ